MARKRLGRRERALAKAIAVRNDAIVRHNSRFMDEVKAEARELQTLRSTLAYEAEVCLGRTHVNSRLIHNIKGPDLYGPKPVKYGKEQMKAALAKRG